MNVNYYPAENIFFANTAAMKQLNASKCLMGKTLRRATDGKKSWERKVDMQQFNLKYFNNINSIINRPDLLRFNMKVTTSSAATSDTSYTTVNPDMQGLTAYRLERCFWKHIVAGETGRSCGIQAAL